MKCDWCECDAETLNVLPGGHVCDECYEEAGYDAREDEEA